MAQATSEQTSRISGPTKKGIRSIGYGLGVLAGILTGGFSTLVGSVLLGGAALYSFGKSVYNTGKSTMDKYKEKNGSYLGRGLSYLGRAVGTVTVPWLQSLASLLSGEERIRRKSYLPYDYPDIEEFEKGLKQKEQPKIQQPQPAQKQKTEQ